MSDPDPTPPGPPPCTLAHSVAVDGRGLFTGQPATATLRPAAAGTGVVFRRIDLTGSPSIPARADHIVPESRRTLLSADPRDPAAPSVQTVEHLLSALAGLGITDTAIELSGPELPIGEGSASLWTDAIFNAGTRPAQLGTAEATSSSGSARLPAIVREPIRLAAGGAVVEALPLSPSELDAAMSGRGPSAFYTYHFDFTACPIPALKAEACRRVPAQSAAIALPLTPTEASRSEYAHEVAPARTFSLLEEAQAARSMGLFTHLTPRDMLVIGPEGPIENALRFDNEPARHKLLDLLGDLALCGRPIVARIVATRSGHAMNHDLARRLTAL